MNEYFYALELKLPANYSWLVRRKGNEYFANITCEDWPVADPRMSHNHALGRTPEEAINKAYALYKLQSQVGA